MPIQKRFLSRGMEQLETRRLLAVDLDSIRVAQSITDLTAAGDLVYFSADDGQRGLELYRSNGGTSLVRDINLGPIGSAPINLTNVNGTVFFSADDGQLGRELWKVTSAGASLVKDIVSGPFPSDPSGFINVGGTLFFNAFDPVNGIELWKSDGTSAGTVLVRDIAPGPLSSTPLDKTNVNGTLYFHANNGSNGDELFRSDGTAVGTVLVNDIFPGPTGSTPQGLTNVNGTLLFSADNGAVGRELWSSTGATTSIVADLFAGAGSSNPTSLTNVNGTLFFAAANQGDDVELWKSNGSSQGTTRVKDIRPGVNGSYPANLTNADGTLFFTADDGSRGVEIWRSNGTTSGTVLLRDIKQSGGSYPTSLQFFDGLLFFAATDSRGSELWVSDGTSAGTQFTVDRRAGAAGSYPFGLTPAGGRLFFAATNSSGAMELVAARRLNDPPKVILGGTVTYNRNGAAVVLASNASVTDANSDDFDGGRLQVTIVSNASTNDRLEIRSGTPAPGVISVSGNSVRLNTTPIGTIVGNGAGTAPLIISFNENATPFAAQALARAITFRTVGDRPSTAQRRITFVVSDGDGGRSSPATATKFVTVTALNANPFLRISGAVNYYRDTDAVLLAAKAVLRDADSPNFAGGQLRVQVSTGADSTNRLGFASNVTVDANLNVRLGNVIIGRRTGNGIGTQDLIVDFNSNATPFRVQQLLRSLTFSTEEGTIGSREISIILTDGDGGIARI